MSKDVNVVGEGACIIEGECSTNNILELVTANEIVESVQRKKISLEEIIYNKYFESSVKCIVDDYNGNLGSTHGKIYSSQIEIAQGQNGTLILEGLRIFRNHVIHIAVKRLKREHYRESLEYKISMSISSHENINRCYDCEEDEEFIYLALERCTHNLNSAIPPHLSLTGGRLIGVIRDIITGIAHLHEHGCVHGDLKPESILLISIGNPIFVRVSLGNGNGRPSAGWCAPELINGEDITHEADMFSLGCLIYFCITGGCHPFGLGEVGIQNTINNNWDRSIIDSPDAFHLVSRLLEHEKQNRLGTKGVLNHPYLWDLQKKSEFLREVHDWHKSAKRTSKVELHVRICLRKIETRVFSNNDWTSGMDPSLKVYLLPSRRAKYKYKNVLDLIRAFRNMISHRKKLPDNLVTMLNGDLQTDIYQYFETTFPNLLIEVYQVIYRECRQEKTFRMYFSD